MSVNDSKGTQVFHVQIPSYPKDQNLFLLITALSLRGRVITRWPHPAEQQEVASSRSSMPLRSIGAGTCGTVFECHGMFVVIKRAENGYEFALQNDFIFHKRVLASFERNNSVVEMVNIPRYVNFLHAGCSEIWLKNDELLPKEYRTDRYALLAMEQILPIPKAVRLALIDVFFPEEEKDSAKANKDNNDCLIRLFLGKRRQSHQIDAPQTSLRKYALHLDQMEDLKLETCSFAVAMAQALALMHWDAHIDANKVEFVLGSGRCTTGAQNQAAFNTKDGAVPLLARKYGGTAVKYRCQSINMWLLDFRSCGDIFVKADSGCGTISRPKVSNDTPAEKRTAGLQLAVDAFFFNDPYFPRPLSPNPYEQEIWEAFSNAYLEAGKKIFMAEQDEEIKNLPARFIQIVISTTKERQRREATKVEAEKQQAAAFGSSADEDSGYMTQDSSLGNSPVSQRS